MTVPFAAPLIGAAISGGAEILGGLLGQNSARKQNEEERAWQEKMAGSQYQRAVADMRAAGLNPAMLYGKGPMSAPASGGARQSEGEALARGVGNAGSSAATAAMQAMQMEAIKAQINDTNSSAALKMAQKATVDMDRDFAYNEKLGMLDEDPYGNMRRDWMSLGRKKREELDTRVSNLIQTHDNLTAEAALLSARKAFVDVQTQAARLGIPFAEAWEGYWKRVGWKGAALEKVVDIGSDVGNLVAKFVPGFRLNLQSKPGQAHGGVNSAKKLDDDVNLVHQMNGR